MINSREQSMTTEALKLYTFPLIIQVNVCAVSPYMVAMFSGQKNVIKPFRNRKFSETFVISGDGATSWVRQTGREEERGRMKSVVASEAQWLPCWRLLGHQQRKVNGCVEETWGREGRREGKRERQIKRHRKRQRLRVRYQKQKISIQNKHTIKQR